MLQWTDERSVLRVKRDIYRFGDIVPSGELSKNKIKNLIDIGKLTVIETQDKFDDYPVVEEVKEEVKEETKIEKPKRQRSKKKKEMTDKEIIESVLNSEVKIESA